MIGCLRTRVRKQPINTLYFESETVIKFYNLKARSDIKGGVGSVVLIVHVDERDEVMLCFQ